MDLNILQGMLDNYECYDSGNRFLGMTSVELPQFNFLTDEVSGPGIMGNLEIPAIAHTESLELTVNWRTINEKAVQMLQPHANDLSFRISQHQYDQSNGKTLSQPTRIDFRGLTKSGNLGKLEKATETESTTVFSVIRLDVYLDNKKYLEYDKLNYRFVVDGVDYLRDYRQSVGLDF